LKKDILLCVALKEELDPYKLPPSIQVLYTKVGKIKATLAVMNAVFLHRPKVIINFGSAGAVRGNIEGLCLIKDVMQREHNFLCKN
jgi:adenosylhomocysteine nucleosidase